MGRTKRNQIRGVILHLEDERIQQTCLERAGRFHLEVVARWLAASGLNAGQKADILDSIAEKQKRTKDKTYGK